MRARGYQPFGASKEQDQLLDAVLDRAKEGNVIVFDLDGCLFDSRYRQIPIFHTFAAQHNIPQLFRVELSHFTDWDMKKPMSLAGLSNEEIEKIFPVFRSFWSKRFFSDEWVSKDHAMPGAKELVEECHQRGAYIVYLTGRDDRMRLGTEQGLRLFGFPYDRPRTQLITKPKFQLNDEDYKVKELDGIRALGQIVAFIDNEPINVNRFRENCPDSLVLWIETDHSPRDIEPHEKIPALRSFYRSTWAGAEKAN